MLSNRKIRKQIKNSLEQPPPFDDFCKENNIVFEPERKSNKKRKLWIPAVCAAAACAIIICGCIPLILSKTQDIKYYGCNNIISNVHDISELESVQDLVVFDSQSVLEIGAVYSLYPISDENLRLGYVIQHVIYEKPGDSSCAYEFNYIIRTYDGFKFLAEYMYEDLSERYEYNGVVYDYEVKGKGSEYETAYIKFEQGDFDYFIALEGFAGIDEIDNESVEQFIRSAF